MPANLSKPDTYADLEEHKQADNDGYHENEN